MLTVKCIQKFRNNHNQIYGYRLQDQQCNTKDVTPQQLKQAIQNNQINIINLTLTSDNRLIDTTPTTQPKQNPPKIQYSLLTRKIIEKIDKPKALKFKSNQNLEDLTSKATLLGNLEYKTLSKDFLLLESNDLLILASNKQIQLDNTKRIKGLFRETEFTSIDFHNTDTSNVTDMSSMFWCCKAQTIDLSSFDTSKVTNMEYMFYCCQAQTIDLSSFNTSNVDKMDGMFCDCNAQTLDLSSFNTSNVTSMRTMFAGCKAKTLDLSSFDTSNVTDMTYIFRNCEVKIIDLSSFNTSNVTNMKGIFENCQAKIKTTDPKLLENIQNR